MIPAYIRQANIQDNIIHYLWDDWNVEQIGEMNRNLYDRFQILSHRANIALINSTAEWIIYRFEKLSVDPQPLQYLECAWAQLIDWRYGKVFWAEDIDINFREEWTGPTRGPISKALADVSFGIYLAERDESPAIATESITRLAKYIITDPTPYLKWQEIVLERLEKLFPLDSEEKLGEVVTREVFDPKIKYNIAHSETLVNQYLSNLDWESNPFLVSPQEMLDEGFEGTPYKFDIERDRRDRFEW